MRKALLLLSLLAFVTMGFSQTAILVTNVPSTVGVYDKYEVSFLLGTYDNPYDPEVIDVYADFISPNGRSVRSIGFYYEDYILTKKQNYEVSQYRREGDHWKIRFTPDTPGRWTFVIHAIDKDGERISKELSFNCQSKDAEGFIQIANSKYLKREAFVNSQRKSHSFYPVGPNVPWYEAADHDKYQKPYGIYDYKKYFESLSGNANYVRIWLNRYQFLSLYGPEHAGTDDGKTKMYFDNTLNQKDAAELDYIVENAKEHNIALMMCIFNFRDFIHKSGTPTGTNGKTARPSDWTNNPFNIVLGLPSRYDFFSDPQAIRITKNMIRYIVARWGYATNVLCWELWNELANMSEGEDISREIQEDMVRWHIQMVDYIHTLDPYRHPISTSLGSGNIDTLRKMFHDLDIVQDHNYQNIQKAKSSEQFSYVLYKETKKARRDYPDKPFFMGEFAFGQGGTRPKYEDKDPWGIDLHNSLWSSAFSGSMGPASFWYWEVLDKKNWYGLFRPVTVFMHSLPVLSDSFTAQTTGSERGRSLVFPNNLETYYLVNADYDTLVGWCQDTVFSYQSLRHLTDRKGNNGHFVDDGVFDSNGYVYTLNPAKRPAPSSDDNSIVLPIKNQPRGTEYLVRWFDAETGLELVEEATTVTVRRPLFRSKRITIQFPSSIRDVEGGHINNTFGDAVFLVTKKSQ